MSIRRLALLPLMVAGVLAIVGAPHAQILHKIPGMVPKGPLPGVKSPVPEQNQTKLYCMGITNEQIDQYIKARQVQGQVLQSEMANANAKKAEADALDKKRDAENQKLAAENGQYMMKNIECRDAAKEKDPRAKEQSRLEALAEEATNANDEARADLLQKRAARVSEAIEVDADKACGGRGYSRLVDCRDKKMAADDRSQEVARLRKLEAEAGKKGDRAKELEYAKKADEIEGPMMAMSQMTCMAEHPEYNMMGAQAPREQTAEEQGTHQAAQNAFSNAHANADKAGQDAAKLDSGEYTKLDHCIRGVIMGDPATPIDAATKEVIQKRSRELKPFVPYVK
jgi:hypothetical protein